MKLRPRASNSLDAKFRRAGSGNESEVLAGAEGWATVPVSETLGSARGLQKVPSGVTAEQSVCKHYCRILCAQVGSSSGLSHACSYKHTGLTEKQCKVEMTGRFHFSIS